MASKGFYLIYYVVETSTYTLHAYVALTIMYGEMWRLSNRGDGLILHTYLLESITLFNGLKYPR